MMIPQWYIWSVLRRLLENSPYVSDYKKATTGRIVRLVNWKRIVRHEAF